MAAKGYGSPDVLRAFSNARLLSEKLGDIRQLFVALCGEASHHMISGNLRASDELGQKGLAIASSTCDPELLIEAHHRQWATKYYMGIMRPPSGTRITCWRPTIPTNIII